MARGPDPAHLVRLTSEEYLRLQHISRLRKAPHGEVVRAKILVLAYEHPDWDNPTLARYAGCNVSTVRKWRSRCSREGPQLAEAPRPGQKRFFSLPPKSPNGRPGLHVAPAGGQTLLAVVDSRTD
jgi:hypothetical protein